MALRAWVIKFPGLAHLVLFYIRTWKLPPFGLVKGTFGTPPGECHVARTNNNVISHPNFWITAGAVYCEARSNFDVG